MSRCGSPSVKPNKKKIYIDDIHHVADKRRCWLCIEKNSRSRKITKWRVGRLVQQILCTYKRGEKKKCFINVSCAPMGNTHWVVQARTSLYWILTIVSDDGPAHQEGYEDDKAKDVGAGTIFDRSTVHHSGLICCQIKERELLTKFRKKKSMIPSGKDLCPHYFLSRQRKEAVSIVTKSPCNTMRTHAERDLKR